MASQHFEKTYKTRRAGRIFGKAWFERMARNMRRAKNEGKTVSEYLNPTIDADDFGEKNLIGPRVYNRRVQRAKESESPRKTVVWDPRQSIALTLIKHRSRSSKTRVTILHRSENLSEFAYTGGLYGA